MALLNLSPFEVAIIAIAAIVVFGRRLPQVAGQAAGTLQRWRRSLEDLRRETGIDRELREARRAVETAAQPELLRAAPAHEGAPPQPSPSETGGSERDPAAGRAEGGVQHASGE